MACHDPSGSPGTRSRPQGSLSAARRADPHVGVWTAPRSPEQCANPQSVVMPRPSTVCSDGWYPPKRGWGDVEEPTDGSRRPGFAPLDGWGDGPVVGADTEHLKVRVVHTVRPFRAAWGCMAEHRWLHATLTLRVEFPLSPWTCAIAG